MGVYPQHDGPMDEWFSHRSAKPSTAVRIRFGPHQNSVRNVSNAVIILFCHTFVILPYKFNKSR